MDGVIRRGGAFKQKKRRKSYEKEADGIDNGSWIGVFYFYRCFSSGSSR
jgi:hypothetical protein